MEIFIYALIDPRDLLPFYVGKTNSPKTRLKHHRLGRGVTPSASYVRELRSFGLRPEMTILESCDHQTWHDREAYWVSRYQKEYGCSQIKNVCEGGRQNGRFLSHTEATRERLRSMFIGRPIPQEQKEQISKSLTGLRQSPETVLKRRETTNARRFEMGLPPLPTYESKEDRVEARQERSKLARREKRRAEGRLEVGSPEWKANLAQKARLAHESRTPEERDAIQTKKRGRPAHNKGVVYGPQSPERRAHQSMKLKQFLATLTPEEREARMTAARSARRKKLAS